VVPFQTFETIIGHESNLAGIRAALSCGKPGHSHLFHGPKGVGKATVATAFAQVLLCKDPTENRSVSCGICTACKKMAAGQHPDFVRIEIVKGDSVKGKEPKDKTRISIDQIRDLSAFLSLTPLESQWKVALIDDAAQMSDQAANALLKTLEEPPEQSILIINTYRPGVLLPTIRSRCTKTRFSGLERAELIEIVKRVVDVGEEEIARAVDLAGGDISQVVLLCESDLGEERSRFLQEMAALNPGTLNSVCDMAEYWSQSTRFPNILIFLKAWFKEQIHSSVHNQEGPESIRKLLSLSQWADGIIGMVGVVNLNRRLVLEAILIRLARLRGATF
jgi:DNA polymerase III subunit delta'